jgi:hypothetical protein
MGFKVIFSSKLILFLILGVFSPGSWMTQQANAANIIIIDPTDPDTAANNDALFEFLRVHGRHTVTRVASETVGPTEISSYEGTIDLVIITSFSGQFPMGVTADDRNAAWRTLDVAILIFDVQPTRILHDERGAGMGGADDGRGASAGNLTQLQIKNNTHYITEGYNIDEIISHHNPAAYTTIAIKLGTTEGTVLAEPHGSATHDFDWGAIIVSDIGETLYDGTVNTKRRCFMWPHFGNPNPGMGNTTYGDNFTAEAKRLIQRAVNWCLELDAGPDIYYVDVTRSVPAAENLVTSDQIIPWLRDKGCSVEVYDSLDELDLPGQTASKPAGAKEVAARGYDLFFFCSHTGMDMLTKFNGGAAPPTDGVVQTSFLQSLVGMGVPIMNCEINPNIYLWRESLPAAGEFKISNDDKDNNGSTNHQFVICDPLHPITTMNGLSFTQDEVVDVWSDASYGGVTISWDVRTVGSASTPSPDAQLIAKPNMPQSVQNGADPDSLGTIIVQDANTTNWNGDTLTAPMAFFSMHSGPSSGGGPLVPYLQDMTSTGRQLFENTFAWLMNLTLPPAVNEVDTAQWMFYQ